jgi:hypothetical protein
MEMRESPAERGTNYVSRYKEVERSILEVKQE